MSREEWWLRLLMISGPKLPYIRRLNPYSFQDVDFNERLLTNLGFSEEQCHLFSHADKYDVLKCLDWLSGSDCHLVTYADSDYPEMLRHIAGAPVALFVKGGKQNLSTPQLAMVGSRRYSHYGERWANYFSQQLAASGLTITSGLAVGIDGICHRGALAVEGTTIAVLGSGLGKLHPKSHLRLAQQILEQNGSLVSEFLPFAEARAEYFPRRNRIISGLSLGVLVIEAELRSGSLITAKYALEQGREVFAIPGPLDNHNSQGTHNLIQQGAMLVAQPTDIIENLNSSLCWLPSLPLEPLTEPLIKVKDTESQSGMSPLYRYLSHEPTPVDILALKTQLSVTDVMIQLLELELSGCVKGVQGGYIRSG
ncbi:DNA-processing protein DprA [Pragia fontium]|uniref:DNA processing protein n=1 Tax=Pragia fontium DSM 5563 = ATCC 49100 TaxID=1122977 RepID=A0AAJ4WCU9_9GAMM|nr:DNA-processing protein DprA [Pragia fontium]AKJ40980.1 hypothetical protein QQ39_01820 [Pragia fontium]SFD26951.1 DNA processing protein [Pragia fontium DSM 5563 = ATCC 49100]